MSKKSPQELLEESKVQYNNIAQHISALKKEINQLESKQSKNQQEILNCWVDSRPRVKLTEESMISWFPILDVYNQIRIQVDQHTKEIKGIKFGLSQDIMRSYSHRNMFLFSWTDLDSMFTSPTSKRIRNRFDPVLVPVGKEFLVFREIKKNVDIPKEIFSNKTTPTGFRGKYSLVAFPFAEADLQYHKQIDDQFLIARFSPNKYKVSEKKFPFVFMIIPNTFLEKV